MNELKIITYQNQRILNTQQLAESYDTSVKRISQNFNTNKERYQEGKHYFFLQGEELSSFLQSANCGTQNQKVRSMYLWTEKGAFLHAKSLNTDKAWELYDKLVDSYFRKTVIPSLAEQARIALALSSETAGRVEEINDDLQNFKKDIPLLPVECDDVQKAVRQLGTKILGEHGTPAYRDDSLRGRVYADIGREIKHKFGVRSYKAIKRKYLDDVNEIIEKYTCPKDILEDIIAANKVTS